MAFNYSPKPVIDSSLVLYLDAANPRSYVSGSSVWTDVSRGGNTGALTNGPTYSSANGGSIVFDGNDDYIDTPLYPSITDGTMSVWVYLKSTITTDKAFIIDDGGGYLVLGVNSVNANRFGMQAWDGSAKWAYDSVNYSLNTWYNVTGTYKNGQTVKIYINGILKGQSAAVGVITSPGTNKLRLSKWASSYTNANIASALYYNRALSATEVLQNYNALKGRYGLR